MGPYLYCSLTRETDREVKGRALMSKKYVPQINEAAIPEDGGWANLSQESVLILSIPDWDDVVGRSTEGYEYVWLYDREGDAYIFCFRLSDKTERAIAFPKDHAGLLLQDGRAYDPFSFLITSQALNEVDEKERMLFLGEVELRRHPQAGW